MKKVILVSAVALLALASCKKDYVCTYDVFGIETSIDYPNLEKDLVDDVETTCEAIGGTWSTK